MTKKEFSVPVIDFGPFLNGDKTAKQATADEVVRAFTEIGFVYLSNHGISEETIQQSFAMSKRFFELPDKQKLALAWTTPESNRGYVSQGREKTTTETDKSKVDELRAFPDLKESFEIGKEPSDTFQNNWPPADVLPGFREHEMAFFKICHELHLQVMNAIALGLGLADGYFER
ncbi:hypothetical protein HDU91_003563, partial [Kappamyces sp. JEL0680]